MTEQPENDVTKLTDEQLVADLEDTSEAEDWAAYDAVDAEVRKRGLYLNPAS